MLVSLKCPDMTPEDRPRVHEGTPVLPKQAAKRQQLLCMDRASLRRGLGKSNAKTLVCDADILQTLLVKFFFFCNFAGTAPRRRLVSQRKSKIRI